MDVRQFSAIVSLCVLLYARHINKKPLEGLNEDQIKERMSEVSFFTLFGLLALILSF